MSFVAAVFVFSYSVIAPSSHGDVVQSSSARSLARSGGEYKTFKQGQNIEDTFTYLRDIIADYIRRHSPVLRKVEGRIVIIGN